MRFTMDGVWIVLLAGLAVAAGIPEATNFTKYPKIFGKSLIRRIIEENGYGYENYTLTTEDGYLVNLNRIVHPKRTGSDRGYPLLLVNGYFMQSEAWLVQPRLDSNLAFVFANEGYDVWLGDHRGTMRSKGHVNLTLEDPRFWNFSFHESGLYDIAAFTDFVLKKTNHKDLIFSCMSLGCSFHAVLATKRPSYNDKIRAAIYFVPLVNNVRKVADTNSLMHLFFKVTPGLVDLLEKSRVKDMYPFLGNFKKEIYHICRAFGGSWVVLAARFVTGSSFHIPPKFSDRKWGEEMYSFTGTLKKEIYRLCSPFKPLVAVLAKVLYGSAFHIPIGDACAIISISPGGSNLKSTKHVLQVYDTGYFAEFDYGREENMKRYGTESAPLYDMKKITSPIAVYYSDADVFTTIQRVQGTIKSFGGPVYQCRLPNFNHLDVAGGSTFRYVLPDVVALLNSLTGRSNDTEKFKTGYCPSMEWIRNRGR